jgi:cytochrome b561
MDRVIALGVGICCVLIGFFAILQRSYYSSQYDRYIDLGQYHYIIGILILIIGLLFIHTDLRKRKRK